MSNPGQYANWLGVLKWSLRYNDGTRPSELGPMSDEKKEFLQKVFDEMTVDETKRMVELMNIVTQPAAESTETESDRVTQKVNALEELLDFVGHIENAKNFFIVGAFEPLLKTIREPTDTFGVAVAANIRKLSTKVTEVLTIVLQNNPKAQVWALEKGTFDVLCNALDSVQAERTSILASSDTPDELADVLTLEAGLLTAFSALVRDNGPGQSRIASPRADGKPSALQLICSPLRHYCNFAANETDALSAGVKSKGKRLVRKSLFFLRHLVHGTSAEVIKNVFVLHKMEEPLLDIISRRPSDPVDDDVDMRDAREHAVVVLVQLMSRVTSAVSVIDDSDTRNSSGKREHSVLQVGQSAVASTDKEEAGSGTAIALLTDGVSDSRPVEYTMSTPERIRMLMARYATLPDVVNAYKSWCEGMKAACSASADESVREDAALYAEQEGAITELQDKLRKAQAALRAAEMRTKDR